MPARVLSNLNLTNLTSPNFVMAFSVSPSVSTSTHYQFHHYFSSFLLECRKGMAKWTPVNSPQPKAEMTENGDSPIKHEVDEMSIDGGTPVSTENSKSSQEMETPPFYTVQSHTIDN